MSARSMSLYIFISSSSVHTVPSTLIAHTSGSLDQLKDLRGFVG
ncbi:unnamed protein product, partial [Ixodes persulcatus]